MTAKAKDAIEELRRNPPVKTEDIIFHIEHSDYERGGVNILAADTAEALRALQADHQALAASIGPRQAETEPAEDGPPPPECSPSLRQYAWDKRRECRELQEQLGEARSRLAAAEKERCPECGEQEFEIVDVEYDHDDD